ncbi:MAG: M48 family metallopeptidase [Candidatus Accumulibacter sp.]|jgi:Zn-dependent protease with chaperone function|nr:M48 family metallopeptidase [Accumulibacter sp.]
MSLDAFYFDGRGSRRHPVRLAAGDGCLLIEGENGARAVPAANVRASEPQGRAPRTLRFAGEAAFCEIGQSAELDALLAALGQRDSIAVRLQKRWRWTIGSLAVIGAMLAAAYFWGLPWGARMIAPHVPIALMRGVSKEALERLDKHLFKPTALPEARRQRLTGGFRALAANDPALAAYGEGVILLFRAAPRLGPNAFALPGGQVALLDELAGLDMDDAEILAVLAHELGHLAGRHGVRQFIQSSVVAAFGAAWFGDVSAAAAALAAALLDSGHSRDMEREADDYAAAALQRQGQSPALLASALEKLETAHRAKTRRNEDGPAGGYLDWLSSHPATGERIRRLRAMRRVPPRRMRRKAKNLFNRGDHDGHGEKREQKLDAEFTEDMEKNF